MFVMVDSSLSFGQPNARNLPHLGIVDIPRDGLPTIMGIQPTIVMLWDNGIYKCIEQRYLIMLV